MRKFNKHLGTVFTEKGFHKFMLPSGEVLPHLVETVTLDNTDYSKVTLTMICNVVSTLDEAKENYKNSETNE